MISFVIDHAAVLFNFALRVACFALAQISILALARCHDGEHRELPGSLTLLLV